MPQIVALTEQLGALKDTITAIDGLLPQKEQIEKAPAKKKASR
jgi:hypothetical protein